MNLGMFCTLVSMQLLRDNFFKLLIIKPFVFFTWGFVVYLQKMFSICGMNKGDVIK